MPASPRPSSGPDSRPATSGAQRWRAARAVEGFDAAVERARLYLEAGADAICPEALETPGEFRRFAKEVRAPLMANMTEFGRGPLLTVRQLQSMGYRMVIFPMAAFRVA